MADPVTLQPEKPTVDTSAPTEAYASPLSGGVALDRVVPVSEYTTKILQPAYDYVAKNWEAGDKDVASVERDPSTWHDHVHVRMMGECRAPGMQHGGDTDPCAEALGIGGDGERRLGRRLHQQVVDHTLVLIGDVTQFTRQRVHDVEVRHRQQLGFTVGEPLA